MLDSLLKQSNRPGCDGVDVAIVIILDRMIDSLLHLALFAVKTLHDSWISPPVELFFVYGSCQYAFLFPNSTRPRIE